MTIVVEALTHYLAEDDRPQHEVLLVLSDKSGVPYDTLETFLLKPDRSESIEFDTADEILCACRCWNWWYTRYEDIYKGVNLNLRQCAHPDCSVWFAIPASKQGGRKEYCSTACANSHKKGNRRVKHFRGKAQRGDHSRKCRNGHERTPENTIRLKSGKIRCRVCNNARSNEGYHRKRGAVATA